MTEMMTDTKTMTCGVDGCDEPAQAPIAATHQSLHWWLVKILGGSFHWKAGTPGQRGGGEWHVTFRDRAARFKFPGGAEGGACPLHTLYVPKDGTDPASTDWRDKNIDRLAPDAYWRFHALMLEYGKPVK